MKGRGTLKYSRKDLFFDECPSIIAAGLRSRKELSRSGRVVASSRGRSAP